MADAWTQRFEVRSYETDPGGRLSVTGLCDYLQEAASAHAVDLGISIGDLGRSQLTWVLGRLQLSIDRLPTWQDAVEVTTWPSRLRGFFVNRDFLVESAGREVLARATSTWFVIDVDRRRAVRIPEVVRALRLPERERALRETWAKLPAPDAPDRTGRFAIRRSDLDLNDHVNHVSYLEWALETLDLEFFSARRLARLEIDFLAELTYGDSVLTEAQTIPDGDSTTVLFSVRGERAPDEAARIRSHWRPAPDPVAAR